MHKQQEGSVSGRGRGSRGDYLRKLFVATRPWSFTTTIGGVLIATTLSYKSQEGSLSTLYFVLSLVGGYTSFGLMKLNQSVGGIGLTAFANVCNTYFDFKYGVDSSVSSDVTLTRRILTTNDVKGLIFVTFALSVSVGFTFLLLLDDFEKKVKLVMLGLVGVALASQYTARPLKLKSRALGDIVIFTCFGPLLMMGTTLVQTNQMMNLPLFHYMCIWGLLTEAVLHVNNTRDMQEDQKSGIVTLPLLIGFQNSSRLFRVLLMSPLLILLLSLVSLRNNVFILLPLFITPLLFRLNKQFSVGQWDGLCEATAQCGFIFSLLLCVGIYLN